MDITNRIDKLLSDSIGSIFGKKKTKFWLTWRDRIFDAKKKSELTSIMKQMEKAHKQKEITMAEFMDLVDKVDQKMMKMGG